MTAAEYIDQVPLAEQQQQQHPSQQDNVASINISTCSLANTTEEEIGNVELKLRY